MFIQMMEVFVWSHLRCANTQWLEILSHFFALLCIVPDFHCKFCNIIIKRYTNISTSTVLILSTNYTCIRLKYFILQCKFCHFHFDLHIYVCLCYAQWSPLRWSIKFVKENECLHSNFTNNVELQIENVRSQKKKELEKCSQMLRWTRKMHTHKNSKYIRIDGRNVYQNCSRTASQWNVMSALYRIGAV